MSGVRIWRGVAAESHYTPLKGPVAPTFSALKGGVTLQVASFAVQGGVAASPEVSQTSPEVPQTLEKQG